LFRNEQIRNKWGLRYSTVQYVFHLLASLGLEASQLRMLRWSSSQKRWCSVAQVTFLNGKIVTFKHLGMLSWNNLTRFPASKQWNLRNLIGRMWLFPWQRSQQQLITFIKCWQTNLIKNSTPSPSLSVKWHKVVLWINT